jgi:addiction module HigA family antidote
MRYTATDNLPAIHPGEILADELDALGLSARKFADHIGVPPNAITAILHGDRSITAEMAMRLGKAFATGELFWMNLQRNYDAKIAREKMRDKISGIEPLVGGERGGNAA